MTTGSNRRASNSNEMTRDEDTTNTAGVARQTGADALLDGLRLLCALYDRPASEAELTAGLPLVDGRLTLDLMRRAASRADLDLRVQRKSIDSIGKAFLPVLLLDKAGGAVALVRQEGRECVVVHPEMPSREVTVETEALKEEHSGLVVLAAPLLRPDPRADDFSPEPEGHWFWGEVRKHWRDFLEVAGAAFLANVLAVSIAFFGLQVYDRVVPNLAFATLWVLAIGAGLAVSVEVTVRIVRARLLDSTGRELDLKLSALVFERAMGMHLAARPRSTGSFANKIRDFDSIRAFFTSTTIGTLSDIPFSFLFIGVVAAIGGWPIALVLMVAAVLIVVPGLLAQRALARLSRKNLREASIRHGLLMEALSGAETVKSMQAESRFQRLWEEYSTVLAADGMRMRTLSSTLTFMATGVQRLAYVMVIFVGVYQLAAGNLTQGGIIACAILSTRTLAPLTQLAGILGRWQQMRAALASMDALMAAQVDRPAERAFVHRPRLQGGYRFENVAFAYDKDSNPALQIPTLNLEAGSATALLGTNGSGKSTLLKLFAGLYQPLQGQISLDGTDMRQVDPADVRKAVAYLPQDVRLFYGTLRDNLRLGVEDREDEELLEALTFVGAEGLVQEHPLGLDRMIGEGGTGVSGGQRQCIGLARIWLRDPRVVILDEPTAAIDHTLELKLINNIKQWAAGRTLIIATHRQPVMALVQRVIVLNGGRPVADGSVEGVLAALASNHQPARRGEEDGKRKEETDQ